jgi:hypothetical protein
MTDVRIAAPTVRGWRSLLRWAQINQLLPNRALTDAKPPINHVISVPNRPLNVFQTLHDGRWYLISQRRFPIGCRVCLIYWFQLWLAWKIIHIYHMSAILSPGNCITTRGEYVIMASVFSIVSSLQSPTLIHRHRSQAITDHSVSPVIQAVSYVT